MAHFHRVIIVEPNICPTPQPCLCPVPEDEACQLVPEPHTRAAEVAVHVVCDGAPRDSRRVCDPEKGRGVFEILLLVLFHAVTTREATPVLDTAT